MAGSVLEADQSNHENAMVLEITGCPLSEGILLEILSRLPLHALLRFKKVSKTFHKLTAEAFWLRPKTTSSASFIIQNDRHWRCNVVHLGSSSNGTAAIVTAEDDTLLLPPSEDSKHHLLLATCNGLLLYRDTAATSDYRCEVYHISNPITQQWFRLPPVFSYGAVCVGFDPKISPHFRVVNLEVACLNVYDSQSKTWCKIDDINMPEFVQYARSCVLVGDVLYADMCYDFFGTIILKVDIRERSFIPIKLPYPGLRSHYNTPYPSLYRSKWGRVHFLEQSARLRMWVLHEEEEKEEWINMFSFDYGFLDKQIRNQLPDLQLPDLEEYYICSGYLIDFGFTGVELVDFVPTSDTTDFLQDHTIFIPVLYIGDCTAIVHYNFRTETVSEVSMINVLADRIFAF